MSGRWPAVSQTRDGTSRARAERSNAASGAPVDPAPGCGARARRPADRAPARHRSSRRFVSRWGRGGAVSGTLWLLTAGPDDEHADMSTSPAERPGGALERSDEVVGDPAAVEIARLRPYPLVVQQGRVDTTRIERDVVAQRLVGRSRFGVRPGTASSTSSTAANGPHELTGVGCRAACRSARPAARRAGCVVAITRSRRRRDWSRRSRRAQAVGA